jgi:hypothetical protein
MWMMGGMPSLVEIRSSSGTNSQILFLDFVDLTFQMRMSATGKFSPHSSLFSLLSSSIFLFRAAALSIFICNAVLLLLQRLRAQ